MIFENRARSALVKYSILLLIKDKGLDETWAQTGAMLILLNKQELTIGKRNFYQEKMAFIFPTKFS